MRVGSADRDREEMSDYLKWDAASGLQTVCSLLICVILGESVGVTGLSPCLFDGGCSHTVLFSLIMRRQLC